MTSLASENSQKRPQYYPILDLVRFIAALLIIFIHIFPEGSTTSSIGLDSSIPTLLGVSFVHALLRPAVPVFFLISSFLLFRKIELDPDNKWKHVGSFCLRLLYLYLFWYALGLPLTIKDIVGYASQGDTYNLIRYVVITLWKGAPRGYWFLASLASCSALVALIKSKKSLTIITVVAGILFSYGCLNAAYFGVFSLSDDPVSKALLTVGNYMELSYCFLEALLFVCLGKIFALHGPFKIKGNIVFIVLSFLLMIGELFLTLYSRLFVYPDAYFLLPVFVFFLMNRIFSINIESESFARAAKKLKKVGSFSYLFHIQFFAYVHWILDATGHNVFREQIALLLIPYFVCVLLAFLLQALFECLSKFKYLGFFRYSY